VQPGIYDNRRILLTGNVGPEGLMEAARYAYGCGLLSPPDLVQIPHQGSRRNVTPAVLNAWLGAPNGGNPQRGTAMVMAGAQKREHPCKKVKNVCGAATPSSSAARDGCGCRTDIRCAARA
jgi:hypothetical protein